MAKRRPYSEIGLPPRAHKASVEKFLSKAEESFMAAESHLNEGNCSQSVQWLADGFEELGFAEAHAGSSGKHPYHRTLRTVGQGGRTLLKEFTERCTRGIRAGGSMHGHDEPDEPEEDDITTTDHQHWYQSGKLYFTGDEEGLMRKMNQDNFWPDVWFISDHGNAHRITLRWTPGEG